MNTGKWIEVDVGVRGILDAPGRPTRDELLAMARALRDDIARHVAERARYWNCPIRRMDDDELRRIIEAIDALV